MDEQAEAVSVVIRCEFDNHESGLVADEAPADGLLELPLHLLVGAVAAPAPRQGETDLVGADAADRAALEGVGSLAVVGETHRAGSGQEQPPSPLRPPLLQERRQFLLAAQREVGVAADGLAVLLEPEVVQQVQLLLAQGVPQVLPHQRPRIFLQRAVRLGVGAEGEEGLDEGGAVLEVGAVGEGEFLRDLAHPAQRTVVLRLALLQFFHENCPLRHRFPLRTGQQHRLQRQPAPRPAPREGQQGVGPSAAQEHAGLLVGKGSDAGVPGEVGEVGVRVQLRGGGEREELVDGAEERQAGQLLPRPAAQDLRLELQPLAHPLSPLPPPPRPAPLRPRHSRHRRPCCPRETDFAGHLRSPFGGLGGVGDVEFVDGAGTAGQGGGGRGGGVFWRRVHDWAKYNYY